MLGGPRTGCSTKGQSHESRVDGQNHFPPPADHASLEATQGYGWPSGPYLARQLAGFHRFSLFCSCLIFISVDVVYILFSSTSVEI